MILDEPTNDLDMETLDLLEELLLDYRGTVLLVSHDRSFLNNVVTSSLIFTGDGKIEEIIGGYDDWQATQQPAEPIIKKEKAAAVPRKERPRKLSFKEKRELEKLPERIDALEQEQVELHQQMANPDSYKEGDGSLIGSLKKRLEVIETELEVVYQRWEELDQIPE